ncbi:unnamed protein product [Prunus brigantina]
MVQLPSLHLWPLSSFNQIPLNPKGTSFDISFSGPVFYLHFYHTLYPFYASSLEPSTCFIIISRRPQNLGFSSHPAPLLLIRTSLQVLALQRESNSMLENRELHFLQILYAILITCLLFLIIKAPNICIFVGRYWNLYPAEVLCRGLEGIDSSKQSLF